MAYPQDTQSDEAPSTPMSADDRFAALVNQSRGLRSEITGESVLGETVVERAVKVKPIRRRFLTNVLPIMIVPLVLLGLLAMAGLSILGQQTNDAVGTTDQILIEHNEALAAQMNSASNTTTAAINEFMFLWFERVDALENADTDANTVAGDLQNVEAMNGAPMQTMDETSPLSQSNIQVLFTSPDGDLLSSSHPETALDDYSSAEWFTLAREGDRFRSFVNDEEHVPSFEFSRSLSDGNVVRVRVPFENLHAELDRASEGQPFDLVVIDNAAAVLLGDTSTEHNPMSLFTNFTLLDLSTVVGRETQSAMDDSAALLDATEEGFTDTDERVTSTAQILQDVDPADFPFSPVEWVVQVTEPLDSISTSLLSFRDVAEDVNERQRSLSLGLAVIMIASIIAAFFALKYAAGQISRPVEHLSDQARTAADVGIPAVVEAARTSDELPQLDAFEVDTRDELSVLASSLNTMQDAAVDLAAGQAQLRRQNVSRTFVSLGRRNQNLLNRQLEFIEELEQQERDADALENLFKLDHLATRMRRNAENLLVLAGEQTPRRWGKPIAVRDVLRAAASEIADYRRVRLGDIDEATVSGNLATDLSHLFAELLENAGSFSPPTTPIEVFGQLTESQYRLAIVDQGIGMDEEALDQVNERLKNPVDFADAPSAYLGLFVVGRLAQELGVQVRLSSADPTGEGHRRGTIAFIDLPIALLSSDLATEVQTDGKASEAVARRTDAVDATDAATAEGATVFGETDGEATQTVTDDSETPQGDGDDVVTEQPLPEPVVATETTTAGFPKRARGATSVKTTPDKFVSDTPAVAEAPAPAVEAAASTAEVSAPVGEAEPADTTTAGFPKRARGATSIKTTPDKFVSETPAVAHETDAQAPRQRDPKMSAVALVNAAKAEARAKAAAEAEATQASVEATAPATSPVPDTPDIPEVPAAESYEGPTTSAGLPKRGGGTSIPQPQVTEPSPTGRTRDAAEVKNSLMSFRAAVARGRGQGEPASMPDPVVAAARVGAAAEISGNGSGDTPHVSIGTEAGLPNQENEDSRSGSAQ